MEDQLNPEKKPLVEIYDWYLSPFQSDLFFNNPKKQKPCVVGKIKNHKTIQDGTYFKTSIIIKYDIVNRVIITDKNCYYKLGSPIENYIEIFPRAEEDFISMFDSGQTAHIM